VIRERKKMPVILAIQEAERRRVKMKLASSRVCKTLSQKNPTQKSDSSSKSTCLANVRPCSAAKKKKKKGLKSPGAANIVKYREN
jgi:hypothetical protein